MIYEVVTLGATGFVAGLGLLYASKRFYVYKDPKILEVTEMLPGANCGGCGYPGCSALAEAIVNKKANPAACPVGGIELAERIGSILGIEVVSKVKKVARIKCRGGKDKCPEKYEYIGPMDCHSVSLLSGGIKECIYGCLGMGSCVKVCAFDAIYLGEDNIPKVNEKKCTSCGMCVKACPRGLIELLPIDKEFVVTCRSMDKGADTKKICSVGCIACRLCVKNCPVEAIVIDGNVAKILPEKCINCGKCEEVCPTHAINRYRQHTETPL